MNAEALTHFFGPHGALHATLTSHEERPEQLATALAVQRNLGRGDRLLVEAGTGSGKTLAYLVPAVTSGVRVVISTATKTLQEQILHKDLPLLERALGRRIDAQLMKGRSNYLCIARTQRFTAQQVLPGFAERRRLDRVLQWARETNTGDRAELTFVPESWAAWREMSATADQCTGRACPDYERCWVVAMRQRAQTADLVIVNHHLYCADLALRDRLTDGALAVLPPHEAVIFDEAHELEETAAQHFGVQVSDARLGELVRDAERLFTGDALSATAVQQAVGSLRAAATSLFATLGPATSRRILPSPTDEATRNAHQRVADALAHFEATCVAADDEAQLQLARRSTLLAQDLAFALDCIPTAALVQEIHDIAAEDEPFVRFLEPQARGTAIVARPLEIATRLQQGLGEHAAVCISATLTVNQSFDYFRSRLGLESARELRVESPFDFSTHSALYIADTLPPVADPSFATEAARHTTELVRASGGGAFVLCTSHRTLAIMREALVADGTRDVLVQGERPRSALLQEFAASGHAVLVATMSFWQGVDIPGSALRLVIIDRLPFASPGDPITASRLAYLRARGIDPFRSYQLPQAVLLLRQGFGRLIRTRRDRGLVAILDRRIVERGYGASFLRSLPECPRLQTLPEAQAYLRSIASTLSAETDA